MDEVEKYMMSRLYKEVFCPETTDDEKKDLAIQKRIRSAHKETENQPVSPKKTPTTSEACCFVLLSENCTGSPLRCCVCLWMRRSLKCPTALSKPSQVSSRGLNLATVSEGALNPVCSNAASSQT